MYGSLKMRYLIIINKMINTRALKGYFVYHAFVQLCGYAYH